MSRAWWPEVPWWHTASLRLRGLGYILAFGFLLMISLAVTTALNLIILQLDNACLPIYQR